MTVEQEDESWKLFYNSRLLLVVTANQPDLLLPTRYLTMEPHADLGSAPNIIWREARKEFEAAAQWPCWAVCETPTAGRFLRFFGFNSVGQYLFREYFVRA